MTDLITVAREFAKRAKALQHDIEAFDNPPSRSQIQIVQNFLNQLQLGLNRIQVETDTWGEEKEGAWP